MAKSLSAMRVRAMPRTLFSLAIRRRICFLSMKRPRPSLLPSKIKWRAKPENMAGDYSSR